MVLPSGKPAYPEDNIPALPDVPFPHSPASSTTHRRDRTLSAIAEGDAGMSSGSGEGVPCRHCSSRTAFRATFCPS